MRPSALVIGPMKSGTSWIQKYFQARDDVVLPAGVKETFFFDRRYQKGIEWYARHFQRGRDTPYRITVEVAPSYFHCEKAPERVAAELGEIPLIVTLRDPVHRAWSHYLHLRRYGYTKLPLRDAAEVFPEVLEASRYQTCLARWERCFGRKNIHVLWQEDLARVPENYARKLCSGLAIPVIPAAAWSVEKQNEAALPSSATLARLGDKTAHFLRARRLYGVVNLAKKIGLKNLFFGKPGYTTLPTLSSEDAHWLARVLADEVSEWTVGERIDDEEEGIEGHHIA